MPVQENNSKSISKNNRSCLDGGGQVSISTTQVKMEAYKSIPSLEQDVNKLTLHLQLRRLLKGMRADAGYSQSGLAKKMGKHQSRISQLENLVPGRVTADLFEIDEFARCCNKKILIAVVEGDDTSGIQFFQLADAREDDQTNIVEDNA